MATVRILLGIICLAVAGGRPLLSGHMLETPEQKLLAVARAELGVREATGRNDGPRVEAYLHAAALNTGNPWCAAFVSWVYRQSGYSLPRTGWSPALFPAARLQKNPLPARIFGIYFPELQRIAHCGFVEKLHGDWITTIEGNTNIAGSREGDGVYRKMRHRKAIRYYADWRGSHD
jgi:hypothetical protein